MHSTPNARNSASFERTARPGAIPPRSQANPIGPALRAVQAQAGDALGKLEPLTGTLWTPEHSLILARNLGVLEAAGAATPDERKEADLKAREILKRAKRGLRATNPEFRAEDGFSELEDEDEDEEEDSGSDSGSDAGSGGPKYPAGNAEPGPATPTPRGGRKRARSDSDDETGRRPKRARFSNPIVQVQPPVDIIKLNPQPIRITYKRHPTEDRSDEWFTEMFRRLFHQMEATVTHYFALHDISGPEHEPWALEMTPEFIVWAEQVAEPNPNTQGWDQMLKCTTTRKWFLIAILMRIFKAKIFDEELWGATDTQKALMHSLEVATFTREGVLLLTPG